MCEYTDDLICKVCDCSLVFDEGDLVGGPDTYKCDGCGQKYLVDTCYRVKKLEDTT